MFRREADSLHWRLLRLAERAQLARPGDRLLRDFLILADDLSGDRIVRFAQRWGVLGICEDGLPHTHNAPPREAEWDDYEAGAYCMPLGTGTLVSGGEASEPLKAWRDLAGVLRALLGIAVALQQDERPRPTDWATVDKSTAFGVRLDVGKERPVWQRNAKAASRRMTELLSDLLAIGDVRPRAAMLSGRPSVTLGGRGEYWGLFGALAVQMLMATTRSDGLYICHACGRPFALGPTERRRQATRNTYCPDCGLRAARRDASERWRRRRSLKTGLP